MLLSNRFKSIELFLIHSIFNCYVFLLAAIASFNSFIKAVSCSSLVIISLISSPILGLVDTLVHVNPSIVVSLFTYILLDYERYIVLNREIFG